MMTSRQQLVHTDSCRAYFAMQVDYVGTSDRGANHVFQLSCFFFDICNSRWCQKSLRVTTNLKMRLLLPSWKGSSTLNLLQRRVELDPSAS